MLVHSTYAIQGVPDPANSPGFGLQTTINRKRFIATAVPDQTPAHIQSSIQSTATLLTEIKVYEYSDINMGYVTNINLFVHIRMMSVISSVAL
jgi:ribosomal protein L30E